MTRTFTDEELIATLPNLKGYAINLVGYQDAEDLVQDVVERALSKSHTFTPGTRLYRWLCRILWNIAIDWRRSGRMRLHDDVDSVLLIDASSPADVRVYALEVIDKIESLHPRFKDVLTEYGTGSNQEETAAALNIPLGTVKSRASRGRDRLVLQ